MSTDALQVIGIGNTERGDDAAGLLALAALAAEPACPKSWSLIEHRGDGAALLERLRGAERVILLDALMLPAAAPGSLRVLAADAIAAAGAELRVSSHALGVGAAVALAQALGCAPRVLTLYGIVGACFALGAPVSAAVSAALAPLAARIIAEHATCHA